MDTKTEERLLIARVINSLDEYIKQDGKTSDFNEAAFQELINQIEKHAKNTKYFSKENSSLLSKMLEIINRPN